MGLLTTTSAKGSTSRSPGFSADGDFLHSLGKRVRELRAQRGMTRKQVSQKADVSERHLAQLESGEGNISVVLLQRIATALRVPMGEIFSLYGQSGFRAIERRTLERVLEENERVVLSVGGGVVSEKETFDFLLSHCYAVWIKAQPEEHMSRVMAQGDFRPMAANNQAMEDLRRILEARDPLYRKADLILDTSGTSAEESFAKLKAALQQNLQ